MSLDSWLPAFTIVVLVLSLVVLGAGFLTPPKHRDPQYGMAIGCGMVVVSSLSLVLVIYLAGRYFHVRWLTRGIEGACLFVVALFLLNLIVGGTRYARGKWRDRREQ